MKNSLLTELLLKNHSIDISKFDETFLEKLIQKRINETLCNSEETYCTLLEQNEKEAKIFFDSLFISYSEFFRNSLTFSVLEKIILPTLIAKKTKTKRKEIRIWSAACATGQETYSLAMLLKEYKNVDGEEINFRIFATDYCETDVNDAQKGEYNVDALNNLSLKRINQWFTKKGDSYSVKPELRGNIDFSVFDLLSEEFSSPPTSIFGDFDLVICANLLFYYKPAYRKKILEKTTQCLTKGGYLMTGETERSILLQNNFEEVIPQSAIFHSLPLRH